MLLKHRCARTDIVRMFPWIDSVEVFGSLNPFQFQRSDETTVLLLFERIRKCDMLQGILQRFVLKVLHSSSVDAFALNDALKLDDIEVTFPAS